MSFNLGSDEIGGIFLAEQGLGHGVFNGFSFSFGFRVGDKSCITCDRPR
jgi:hypothetical protein